MTNISNSTNWLPPLPFTSWRATNDSWSFQRCDNAVGEIPIGLHVGAFGTVRKHHTHEGIDLYAPEGTAVFAVEHGVVVVVEPFTGPGADSPWWMDTQCVMVEGKSGVVVYGEIDALVVVGETVDPGQLIGTIARVLPKNKGRPQDMLHLELHIHGTRACPEWIDKRPKSLLDPTPYCLTWVKSDHS